MRGSAPLRAGKSTRDGTPTGKDSLDNKKNEWMIIATKILKYIPY